MQQDLVIQHDEIRRRSDTFWLRRYQGLWPIEAQGHTFFANAILSVGRVLFGSQWDDDIRLFQAAVGGVRSNRVPYEDAIEPIEEAAELCLDLMERVHEAVVSLTREAIDHEGAAK
jgi:hypothetical protein